jgi:hypothetical protein
MPKKANINPQPSRGIPSASIPQTTTNAGMNCHEQEGGNPKRIKRNNDSNDNPSKDSQESPSNNEQEPSPQPQPQSQVNAYDSMLGEIHDLLMAAQEAQSLGRLRMASTYQMLAHTRLVGLGKRFDRCWIRPDHHPSSNSNIITSFDDGITNTMDAIATTNTDALHSTMLIPQSSTSQDHQGTMQNRSDAQAALAKMLPSNVNVDDTMMEHLARAAMELHNRRTGRGMQSERFSQFQIAPPGSSLLDNVTSFMSSSTSNVTTSTTNASVGSGRNKNTLRLQKGIHHSSYPDHKNNPPDDDDDNNNETNANHHHDEEDEEEDPNDNDEEVKGYGNNISSPDRQKRGRGKSQPTAMLTV